MLNSSKYFVFIALILTLSGCFGPSNNTIENIVRQYNENTTNVEVLSTGRRDAYTIVVVEVTYRGGSKMICEMPMIERSDGWSSTGISCQS